MFPERYFTSSYFAGSYFPKVGAEGTLSPSIAQLLDKYLKALFDVDDSVYQSLISNVRGLAPEVITTPMQFNKGAIGSTLEWLRNLGINLSKQIYLNEAEDKYLDYMVHDHIGIVRFEDESNTDYQERVKDYVIAHKCSIASIIYYTRKYSTTEPEILDGYDDAMYADVSFSDVYTSFQNEGTGPFEDWWVFPAITISGASAYFFILRLTDTATEDIAKVLDLLERWHAGGIEYELHIL